MITIINRIMQAASRWSAWIGMFLLLTAMLTTCTDILLRKVFNWTYLGTIDIIQLLILWAAFLTIPYAFITRSHVAVVLIVDRLSPALQSLATVFAALLSTIIMSSFTWFGYFQAQDQISYGDVSQSVGIPIVWYWIPVIYGCALSTLVTIYIAIEGLAELFSGGGSIDSDPAKAN